MRIFQNKERGVAVVEFALVVPLLLMVLFGIIEFGILFYNKAVITNASREATRQWIVFSEIKPTKTDLLNIVNNYTNERLISFSDSSTVTIETKIENVVTNDTTTFDPGDELTLTVQYPYSYLVMPGFLDFLLPTINLKAQTKMKAEY